MSSLAITASLSAVCPRDAACVLVSAESRALMEQALASEADNQQMSARVAALLAGSSLTTKQGVRLPGEPRQVDMVQYDGGTYPATPHAALYILTLINMHEKEKFELMNDISFICFGHGQLVPWPEVLKRGFPELISFDNAFIIHNMF